MSDNAYQLGIALVKNNVLDFDVLEKALKVKNSDEKGARRNLAQILVSEFKIDHNEVYKQVAKMYGFPEIPFSEALLSEERISFIRKVIEPLSNEIKILMQEEKVLVLQKDPHVTNKLLLVAADPTNRHIPTIARSLHTKRYEVCYLEPLGIDALSKKVFHKDNEILKVLEDADIELGEEELDDESFTEEDLNSEINKSLLVQLVEGMLVEAVRKDVSDIHIIPKDTKTTEIFFRVDGKLSHWYTQTGVRPEALSAVVKDRSKNVDRFERELAQDGFIQRKIDGHMIRYRVSILPIVGKQFQYKYESIVIRILDDRKVITDFEVLGLFGHAKSSFIKAISKPQGMVIVTGPTGSGKSTTLMAALHYVIKPEVNVLTVEDPVEYIIEGARQLKISDKNNFDRALRAILRHDPDIVMVGEIRDKVTAETAIKLSNTGHLTFSTLHTNDAPSAVSRLYKIGVEPFLIAYAINIIVAQRLIRRICGNCKQPVKDIEPEVPRGLGFSDEEIKTTVFYRGAGCDICHGRGYKGRVAIHEALYFSKAVRNLIFSSGDNIAEEALRELARKEGMQTLREAAKMRVMQGHSTLEELASTTSDD